MIREPFKSVSTSPLQRSLKDSQEFTLTFELVPSRGGRSKELSRILALSQDLAADRRIRAVSITENAGGHPALSPEVLGLEIKAMGLDVISHFSCKDKNRNQMESLLYAWERAGLQNLLVITGDYPKQGYHGCPKPVFDLGSVQVLKMMQEMNRGVFVQQKQAVVSSSDSISPTSFVKGVAVSPFKMMESELVMQYAKLHRKIEAGADFVITQVGFDARKFHEVLLYMQQQGLQIPVLGNVFIPNMKVVDLMYQGMVPGCIIPEALYREFQDEARTEDKGKHARLERAAKILSVLKGMGYDGAHIGGPGLDIVDLDFVLNRAKKYEAQWPDFVRELSYWPKNGSYYYLEDETTGLNLPECALRKSSFGCRNVKFLLAKKVHDLVFEDKGAMCAPMKKICLRLEKSFLSGCLAQFEYLSKFVMFNCQNCGDCTLAELAFLCPQSGCAKYLLNGACGGSRDGWCEVYPNKKRCFYVRVYERLKYCSKINELKAGYVPPRNWELNNTSSWVNFYTGKDHTGKVKQCGTGRGHKAE